MAPLETLSFAVGDYRTDGRRLVWVKMILDDGDVLVEDAATNRMEHIAALELNAWSAPREWEARHAS